VSKFSIQISSKAKKDLKKISSPAQKKIIRAIQDLKINQRPQQFKPLVRHEIAQCRLRIGDYRVLYDIYEFKKTVLILRIGHRRDIYR